MALRQCVAPDDLYLGSARLADYGCAPAATSKKIALKLQNGSVIVKKYGRFCIRPLPDAPGHEIWKRDFLGARDYLVWSWKKFSPKKGVEKMIDEMRFFGIGSSWGGYESLILPGLKFVICGQLRRGVLKVRCFVSPSDLRMLTI
ncbi:MAG: hypothetical protein Ct9H300mP21_04840 [Pseudomonadota bacterium]|nr:MAG: hypothetical protein Ct9H300mP21_04840 [Pseudomonadota bacterium]